MTTTNELAIWVVYDHPKDYPEYFVARRWIGDKHDNTVWASKDLDALRDMLAKNGLTRLHRMEGDDPVIMETWL